MEPMKRIQCWIYTGSYLFTLLCLTGETDAAARFLNHVPLADITSDLLDPDTPDYDADVKLPGRHYPKLPYQNPYLENDQDDFKTQRHYHQMFPQDHQQDLTHGLNHRMNPQTFQDTKHQVPVMAYGVRRDPHGSTFSRQSHSHNVYGAMSDYVDDTVSEREYTKTQSSLQHGMGGHWKKMPPAITALPPSPSFDRNVPRSITVQTGKTATLICRVMNAGEKSVSWMRHEDLHILTVGKYKYSTDSRLSVTFNEEQQEWVLKIKSVIPQDAGLYECQVSTKPVLSFIVSMNVTDSTTTPFPHLRDAGDPALQPKAIQKGEV
ncbi:hypothetical protein SK128_001122 [Halocaridina rubra]|uniref:Ig-like domain-containing protein n=1 Tax=Halocaridina rubra TaxID=373956 RepID=A0AAN9A1U5_HALRR